MLGLHGHWARGAKAVGDSRGVAVVLCWVLGSHAHVPSRGWACLATLFVSAGSSRSSGVVTAELMGAPRARSTKSLK